MHLATFSEKSWYLCVRVGEEEEGMSTGEDRETNGREGKKSEAGRGGYREGRVRRYEWKRSGENSGK